MLPRALRRRGFTLIELIVTCLLIGILASFAIPQYLKTVENSKADDAVSLVNMIGTTNRMFALDHSGWYVVGPFTLASCGGVVCPAAVGANVANACVLVACNYLADQSWANKPYNFFACDNTASSCAGLAANRVSGAKRKGLPSPGTSNTPYTNWGYTMDTAGAIYKSPSTGGSGDAPTPVY